MLGVPAPYDDPSENRRYLFEARTDIRRRPDDPDPEGLPLLEDDEGERGVFGQVVSEEGRGFADVWKHAHFCWEYKRPGGDLKKALRQLKEYKDQLHNPPLLIVSDFDTFEIHTNFTGYPPTVERFSITDLANPGDAWRDRGVEPRVLLKEAFTDPSYFRPKRSAAAITEDLAGQIGDLSKQLREAKGPGGEPPDPHEVAHFLMQVVFCFFAEDVGLLPKNIFTDLIERCHRGDHTTFPRKALELFRAMAEGGDWGPATIQHFNGALFRDIASQPNIPIPKGWLGRLLLIGRKDWSGVEPAIFGTLFERSLDPGKRSQIGAHYTSRDDILLIVEPVIMAPLRKEWRAIQDEVAGLVEKLAAPAPAPGSGGAKKGARTKARRRIERLVLDFGEKLGTLRVLDPACGSGNFLYVAIQQLLDLEKDVLAFAQRPEINVDFYPKVSPAQLFGIDINDYAAELARVTIWIGYLQWLAQQEEGPRREPILDPLDTIECRDAILDRSDPETPTPAAWPEADYIIGNPPFLGTKILRRGLGDHYVEDLFTIYGAAIPPFSDLCCYWFELARREIERSKGIRAGLLATQGIRGGDNRTVLKRIKQTGEIFLSWSDRPWILDGAAVHI